MSCVPLSRIVRFVEKPCPDDERVMYKAYDERGRLLYVGITRCLRARLRNHLFGSGWADDLALLKLASYPDESSARVAEQAAIKDELPLWNRQCSPIGGESPAHGWIRRTSSRETEREREQHVERLLWEATCRCLGENDTSRVEVFWR